MAIAAADLVRGSRNPLNDQWSDTLQRATLRREAKQLQGWGVEYRSLLCGRELKSRSVRRLRGPLMPSERTDTEIQRRKALWDSLIAQGGPTNVAPKLLRELRIYGGAQGIWVNKNTTAVASPDGVGVAVGALHNGSSYDDDLSDDGIIYHFPDTDSEAAALRSPYRSRYSSSRIAVRMHPTRCASRWGGRYR